MERQSPARKPRSAKVCMVSDPNEDATYGTPAGCAGSGGEAPFLDFFSEGVRLENGGSRNVSRTL
jgi:hypothetical protein